MIWVVWPYFKFVKLQVGLMTKKSEYYLVFDCLIWLSKFRMGVLSQSEFVVLHGNYSSKIILVK